MNEFPPDPNKLYDLPRSGSWPEAKHRFSEQSIMAIRAALAARRPLLLRGEPGIGKSQLARAAAHVLGVPFLSHVVNERSERDELLYTYDAVARLGLAQAGAAMFMGDKDKKDERSLADRLAEPNFICPGVLWWAYHWGDACTQAKRFNQDGRGCELPEPRDWKPSPSDLCGPVVLIDEIDKADPSVPNGLLESLGNEGFTTPQLGRTVRLDNGAKPPLVIITTNEERELPAAFLRRCLVLPMPFPAENDAAAVENFLIRDRARVNWTQEQVSDTVCRQVISQLLGDRANARAAGQPQPGAAEFLDILRILTTLCAGDEAGQLQMLAEIKDFAFQKNLIEPR